MVQPRLDHQRAGAQFHHHIADARGGRDAGPAEGLRRARLRLLQCVFNAVSSVTVCEICQVRVVCTERLRGRAYMSRCYCCMGSCRSWSARASISHTQHEWLTVSALCCRRHQDHAVRGVAGRRQDVALCRHPALCTAQRRRQALGLGPLQPQRARRCASRTLVLTYTHRILQPHMRNACAGCFPGWHMPCRGLSASEVDDMPASEILEPRSRNPVSIAAQASLLQHRPDKSAFLLPQWT